MHDARVNFVRSKDAQKQLAPTSLLSYSCIPNTKSIISSHSKTLLSNYSTTQQLNKQCKCRTKEKAPLKCNVPSNRNNRHRNRIIRRTRNNTLKNVQRPYKIPPTRQEKKQHCQSMNGNWKTPRNPSWKVLRKCKPYNNTTKKCNLCLYEKMYNNLQERSM